MLLLTVLLRIWVELYWRLENQRHHLNFLMMSSDLWWGHTIKKHDNIIRVYSNTYTPPPSYSLAMSPVTTLTLWKSPWSHYMQLMPLRMLQLVPLGNDSRSMTRTSSLNMLMLFMPMQRSCLNTMDGMFTDSHMPIKNVAVISLTFYLEEVDLYNDLKKVATQTFEIP